MNLYQEREHDKKYTAEYERKSRIQALMAEAITWQECSANDYVWQSRENADKIAWQHYHAESSAIARFALFRLIDMNAGRL